MGIFYYFNICAFAILRRSMMTRINNLYARRWWWWWCDCVRCAQSDNKIIKIFFSKKNNNNIYVHWRTFGSNVYYYIHDNNITRKKRGVPKPLSSFWCASAHDRRRYFIVSICNSVCMYSWKRIAIDERAKNERCIYVYIDDEANFELEKLNKNSTNACKCCA